MDTKILSSALFKKIENKRRNAVNDNDNILEMYCCMYEMALIETQTNNPFKNIEIDEIPLKKEEYEQILQGMDKYNRYYKKFVYKNAVISGVMFLIIFIAFRFLLEISLPISLLVSTVVFLIDLYINGKTNDKRFKDKWIRIIDKKIDLELVNLINHYFQ